MSNESPETPEKPEEGGRAPAEEGSGARVVQNTLAFAGSSGAGVLVALVLTPVLINQLGASAYGVWILATTLTFGLGYLSIADLGIEQAAVRYIAAARAQGDAHRVAMFASGAVGILSVVGLALTPVLVLLAPVLVGIFSIPDHLTDDAVLAFRLVALQLLVDLPGRGFLAVLQGAQDYPRWQAVELTRTVLLGVALIGAALLGFGIVGLAAASLAVSALVFALGALVAMRAVPEARPSLRLTERAAMRELAAFSSQLFVFRLTGLVYRQTDKTIIGIILSAAAVTSYDIAIRIQTAVDLVSTMITSAVTPTAAFHERAQERIRDLFLRGSAYTVAGVLPFGIAVAVFAEPAIRTWIGAAYTDSAGTARIFVAVLTLAALVSVGQSILVGTGRVREMMWLNIVWIALNLPVSIALAQPLGIEGVALGTLVSQAVIFVPLVRLLLRTIGVSLGSFLRSVVLPVIPGSVTQVALAFAFLPFAQSTGSVVIVALLALASVGPSLGIFLFAALPSDERRDLLRMLRVAVRR